MSSQLPSNDMFRFAGFAETLIRGTGDGGVLSNPKGFTVDAEAKEKLRKLLRYFAEAGYNFHLHTTQDNTARQMLTVIEEVNGETPFARQRIAFAHLEDATPETIARIKKLGGGRTRWCSVKKIFRPGTPRCEAMKNSLGEKLWVKGIIASHLGVPGRKIFFTEHHQSHAAAAFFSAPTRRAAILTADGVGEWATLTVGVGQRRPGGQSELQLLREVRFPHSLGMLYSTFTAYLGFPVNEGEYKVMGLAAYGKPSFEDQVRKPIPHPRWGLPARPRPFRVSHHRGALVLLAVPGRLWAARDRKIPSTWTIQRAGDSQTSPPASRRSSRRSGPAVPVPSQETGCTDLCFGGGWRSTGVPTPGSSGKPGSSGSSSPRLPETQAARWERPCGPIDRIRSAGSGPARPSLLGAVVDDGSWRGWRSRTGCHPPFRWNGPLVERVADELASGHIVGWMQGGSEFGPRALGNRSILAAPGPVEMRDRVNRSIKYREEFRPFAPAVRWRRRTDISSCLRVGRGSPGRCRESSPSVRLESGWRRSPMSTGPPGCRPFPARWLHCFTPCSRPTERGQASRCC